MATFTPQDNIFEKINYIDKKLMNLFFLVLCMPAIKIILDYLFTINYKFYEFFNTLYIIFIIIYFIGDYYVELYLFPEAEKKRVEDLIDNSLGSKYSIKPSVQYYSNEELNEGTYKLLINIFENCFFSKKISQKMIRKYNFISSCVFIILLIAIINFSNNIIIIPLLQLFISKNILGKRISLHFYNKGLKKIFCEIKEMISDENENNNAKILKIYSNYQSILSYYKIRLDSKIFNDLNKELSEEWEKIKLRYNITGSEKDEH